MNKRLITEHQQKILMLVHHDFHGLSRGRAALILNISPQAVNDALKVVKKALPQYFPILTTLEMKCYRYFVDLGWRITNIAEHMKISFSSVQNALKRAKGKGMWWPKGISRMLSYSQFEAGDRTCQDWIDAHVKERF